MQVCVVTTKTLPSVYSSIQTMNPAIWGRHAWNFMHLVTMGYPEYPTEADKQHYYDYLSQLRFVLPCSKCRNGYTDHLVQYPLTEQVLSSRNDLVKWGIDLHNAVNINTGKPQLSYPVALEHLAALSSPPAKSTSIDYLYIALIVIALLILCFLIYFFIFRK